jgi:hypothetical protein
MAGMTCKLNPEMSLTPCGTHPLFTEDANDW